MPIQVKPEGFDIESIEGSWGVGPALDRIAAITIRDLKALAKTDSGGAGGDDGRYIILARLHIHSYGC